MGPRIFGIPARDASTIAIIRRGPSGWCHLSRWEPARQRVTSGSWLHGTIYPQRCDLSPDGRWLVYFALKSGARWDIGDTYLVVSRLPWLSALAAWSTAGTWTRGLHFVDDSSASDIGAADIGDLGPLTRRYGLVATAPVTFAVERRGGWAETAATPERRPADAWDEQRADQVVMEKPQPGSDATWLRVGGWLRCVPRVCSGLGQARLFDQSPRSIAAPRGRAVGRLGSPGATLACDRERRPPGPFCTLRHR